MPDAPERTFTEAEHVTLLADRVQQQTAEYKSKNDELSKQLAELTQRVDVLEAEKAAAISERDKVTAEFDEFKTGLTELAAIEARRDDRVKQVKAANESLPDTYFTPERAQRWAEMTDDQFAGHLDDLSAAKGGTPSAPKRETAAFSGGESPGESKGGSALGRFLSLQRN